LAEILLIVSGNTHDRNQQQQHLSSSASSEQLSLLPMFQTAYDDIEDRIEPMSQMRKHD
jgi:hypothetical protein